MVKFQVKIENIVASTTFDIEIPLEKIVNKYKEMEYEPEQFPGVIYRLKKPRAAALIFSSGKIVCTGDRNLKDVKYVLDKIVRMLLDIKVKVQKDYEIIVENIVASAKFDAEVNLDKIAYELETAEYEPEQFPGLVYRMKTPKVAFLIFGSGKVICTGARSVKDAKETINELCNKLEEIGAFKREK
jgi:transcription initiation factor TFIID TATA-box-binding protein